MKKILVVGGNSKLARLFLDKYGKKYELHVAYNRVKPRRLYDKTYRLDLASKKSVKEFISAVEGVSLDALLFFSSTYQNDSPKTEEYYKQIQSDTLINAISPAVIAKNLKFKKSAKVIFFGDAGTSHPKPGYSSYSISKTLLRGLTKILAVELKDRAQVFCFMLGPIKKDGAGDEYYSRNLIKVDDPVTGLVNYIDFVINEPNLNSTGTSIGYDGGAYLKRAK